MLGGRLPLAVIDEALHVVLARYAWDDTDVVHFTAKEIEESLATCGFSDVHLAWSGFCCQGDGASFTANVHDVPQLVKFLLGDSPAESTESWLRQYLKVKVSSADEAFLRLIAGLADTDHADDFCRFKLCRSDRRYVHKYTVGVEQYSYCEISQRFYKLVLELYRDMCSEIYSRLEEVDEYEKYSQDRAVEHLESQDIDGPDAQIFSVTQRKPGQFRVSFSP